MANAAEVQMQLDIQVHEDWPGSHICSQSDEPILKDDVFTSRQVAVTAVYVNAEYCRIRDKVMF